MKIIILTLNVFVYLVLVACRQESRHSEIADAPCVIIIPESRYVVIGNPYRAQIILTCAKPDSAKQITVRTDLEGEPYVQDGKLYWEYSSPKVGEIIFKGEVLIKEDNGMIQKYPFEDKFYSALPNSLVSNNKLNYLIRGEENSIAASAAGFPNAEVGMIATNAIVKKNTIYNSEYAQFIVIPNSSDSVKLTTFVTKDGKIMYLGTFLFKVVSKFSVDTN